jgi:GNAT superfamily N-acetyltransferase
VFRHTATTSTVSIMNTSSADHGPTEALPRKATLDEAGALADVLALALFDDPVNLWAFPDAKRRGEILPAFMRVFVDASLRQGETYTMDDLSAASLWFPPGWEMNEPDAQAFEDAIRAASGEYAESETTIFGLMERVHPRTPHFYLAFVGTRPDRQGKGIGSLLMKAVLDRCDGERAPAYLEASAERNRRLYGRLGFEVQSSIDLPDGPSLWGMWREPRP